MTRPWLDPVKHRDWWQPVDSPVRVTVTFDEAWRLLPGKRDRRWVATVWTLEDSMLGHPCELFELEAGERGFDATERRLEWLYLFTSCRHAEKDEAAEWAEVVCQRLCASRRSAEAHRDLRATETVMVWSCDNGVVKRWEQKPERSRC